MRKIKLLLSISMFFVYGSHAQKKAVTENGDEVILYENGTWKYVNKQDESDSIQTNGKIFSKTPTATFLLKSKKTNLGFWLDPKKWSFGKGENNPDAEFELQLKGQSVSAYVIPEETDMTLEALKNVALTNGKGSAPDLHIINQEYRTVNNLRVLYLQMEGTTQGLKFVLCGYYYSNENSIVQLIVTTYPALVKKYAKDIEELLNGLVEIKSSSSDSLIINKNKELQNNDSLPQGSLSSNNNCRLNFPGKWVYKVANANITVERSLEKTIEYTDNGKYRFEYDNKWINDCQYQLIFKKTTKPNYTLSKIGEVFDIEILEIDNKTMRYKGVFRKKETEGEMTKIK
jgi:hypothetical protein